MKYINITLIAISWVLSAILQHPCLAKANSNWWPKQKETSKVLKLHQPGSLPEQALAQSLSGLAAKNVNLGSHDELVWINTNSKEYEYLFETTAQRLQLTDIRNSDIWKLTAEYHQKDIVQGYILYSSKNNDQSNESNHSLNIATSMAGLLNGVLIEESLETKAKEIGLKKLYDARNKKIIDIFSAHKDSFNKNLILAGNPNLANMRDMAIAHNCIAIYGTDETVEKIYQWANPLSPIIGWNKGDESTHVSLASKYGLFETVSDFCMNIPFLSANSSNVTIPQANSANPWLIDFDNSKDCTAFFFSDGDNVQWNMGSFNLDSRYWANKHHGEFPMSWSCAASNLIQISPETLKYRINSQPNKTSLIDFSGGYFYPDLFASERPNRKKLLKAYAKKYSQNLAKTGVKVICMLCKDVKSQQSKEAYEIFAKEVDGIIGIVAFQYHPYNGGNGETFWFKTKNNIEIPVVTAKYTTWNNASWERGGSPEKIANLIKEDTQKSKQQDLSIAINHAWSTYEIDGKKLTGLDAVENLYGKIKDDVNVVNIEELIWRLRMNHNPKQTKKIISELQAANLKRNIYVVDPLTFSPAEQTMTVTLQGLLANDPDDVIMIRSGGISSVMLDYFRNNGNKIISIDTPWDLLYRFKDRIGGAILYKRGNDSINVATSLCGPLNSIAITESLVSHIKNVHIPILKDVRDYDEKRAFNEFKQLFSKNYLIEQNEEKHIYLRDFAIANNAFTYYGINDAFRKEIAQYFGSNALIFGWGDDEYQWVKDISKNNQAGVPADWSKNLSVMQSMKIDISKRPKSYPQPAKDGERIVAFVMTDGDNVQWMAGGFVSNYGFWANKHRGEFNMSWEMAPVMADVASMGLNHFYETASNSVFLDDFVSGPSGAAYCFPSLLSDSKDYTSQTSRLMAKSDLSIMTILDSSNNLESAKDFLEQDEIMGVLFKDFSPYHKFKGQIYWHKGKPAVSYKYVLWEPDYENSPDGVAEAISKMPNSPTKDQNSYALINVHAWSYGNDAGPLQSLTRSQGDIGGPMEAVNRTIDLLPENTRVVTASELIILLRNNFGKPVK